MDLRAIDDMGRQSVVHEFSNRVYQICDERSVSCFIEHKVMDLLRNSFLLLIGTISKLF